MYFLAGFPPFDTERDVFDKLDEYLTGHGHVTYPVPDYDRQDKLVALVQTDVHMDAAYPVKYATVEIEWDVRGDPSTNGRLKKDIFRLEWMDKIDPQFTVEQSRRRNDPFPGGFTPTVGIHQDDEHQEYGANHWQIEFPDEREPDRHAVPYTLVGEDPTAILDYFLHTAPQKLSEARDQYRE